MGELEAESTVQLSVPEMDCPSCAGKVENSVRKLAGIESIDPQVTTGTLTVAYDGEATSAEAVAERVEKAGYTVESGLDEVTERYTVPEMDCASCAGKVENALESTAGVNSYQTQPTTGTVVVSYDRSKQTTEGVTGSIESAGYEVTDATGQDTDERGDVATSDSIWRSSRALKTWISGGFTVFGLLVEFLLTGFDAGIVTTSLISLSVADLLFLVAVAFGGQEIIRGGYYSLRNRNLDIDLLMSIAIAGAVLVSLAFGEELYMEAATLAFLFSVAELLERYSMDKARNSLQELMDLSPDEATVRRDGEEVTIPVDEVQLGDVVVVKPGEKIPMDGEVVEGESAVNQAPITGESVPVDKTPGDEVYAGTINEQGYLEVEVTSAAGDNTLSRIVEMVEDAQSNKTEREQFVERFAAYYTPVVVTLAVLTAAVPPLVIDGSATLELAGFAYTFTGAWETWFVHGLTLIVLACPCAFVISTPVSVVSGITSGAKNGVLIKGGNYLEAMGEVDAVAMDKTGTLTKGELTVTDVIPLGDNTEEDVLRCARGLESRSEHPIGEAIVERATERGASDREVDDFESITGKGVKADLDGVTHYAGKPGFFDELGFDLDHVHAATDGGLVTQKTQQLCEKNRCLDLLQSVVPDLQAEGKTVVLVGTEDDLEGVIAVADEVRPKAKRAVARLRELGIDRVVMLTGDNERTAQAIAEQVGVDEYRAELLPDEKVEAIRELDADTEGGVAMVGDGVNDAPALATASVGIAMGAAGTDTALETADIALMGDDLSRLPYLYELSHDANGVIRQNIWTSLAAKATLAAGVPFGLVPIWAAVLIGDAGMTLGVTGNAMRLSRIRPDELLDDRTETADTGTA
ncbi:heavy metal translocating P-type ATPase [Halosimplex aquaticum]|uniref:P-type Cu(+) transporter n=1 Tax=Halosimplex aquaticum TaxID=3026162 RepID=A0ABD5Y446_9EURY|nr:heavy metal translocating P-type ATPase [Halosimplex aquaticum]